MVRKKPGRRKGDDGGGADYQATQMKACVQVEKEGRKPLISLFKKCMHARVCMFLYAGTCMHVSV